MTVSVVHYTNFFFFFCRILDMDSKVRNNLKSNISPKKSSNHQGSVVTAL